MLRTVAEFIQARKIELDQAEANERAAAEAAAQERREREDQVAAVFEDWLRVVHGLVLDEGETGAVEKRAPEQDGNDPDGKYVVSIMFPPDGGVIGVAQDAFWRPATGLYVPHANTWRATRAGDGAAPRVFDNLADAIMFALPETAGIAVDLELPTAVDAVA